MKSSTDLSVARAPCNVKTWKSMWPSPLPSLYPLLAHKTNGRLVEEFPCLLLDQGSVRINTSRECTETMYYYAGLQNVNIFSRAVGEKNPPGHNTRYLACGQEASYTGHAKQSRPNASPWVAPVQKKMEYAKSNVCHTQGAQIFLCLRFLREPCELTCDVLVKRTKPPPILGTVMYL